MTRDFQKENIKDILGNSGFKQGIVKEGLTGDGKFNEEWAIRKGQFGASEAYQEIEFTLDEQKIRLNPQPFELKEIENVNNIDLRITIPEKDVFLKSANYDGNPHICCRVLAEKRVLGSKN